MRQLHPVLWTKGVLLTPQHLQAHDRQLRDTLTFQVDALTFCPWGFSRLSFDLEALAGGTLVVTAASGRFPDGMLFDAPHAGPTPAPRAIHGAFSQDQRAALVFLAVPEYRRDARNLARPNEGGAARWRIDERGIRDETTGLQERPVQVAVPNLRLLLEGESSEGYTVLPVARLLRSPTGEISLDAEFVPPLLDVGVSESLMAMLRRVVERLAAKSASLAAGRRQRNQGLADFSVTDIVSFWLLHTVNTHFPAFRHFHEVRHAHPLHVWEAMTALTGALTTFGQGPGGNDARTLPVYDHMQLGSAFKQLEARLFDLLDSAVAEAAVALPLKAVRPTLHAVAIDHAKWLEGPQWYLAVSAPLRQQDLIPKVLHGCKVGSADVVENLIRQALPGLEMAHVASPPPAVPVKLDFQYFALRKSGSSWDAIERARNLAVYVPAELSDARFELVIVLR